MCVCVHVRAQVSGQQSAEDEADAALHSTCGGEDNQGGRGERAGGRDEGTRRKRATRRREAGLHFAGGDGELLQIQPVLSAAAQ